MLVWILYEANLLGNILKECEVWPLTGVTFYKYIVHMRSEFLVHVCSGGWVWL